MVAGAGDCMTFSGNAMLGGAVSQMRATRPGLFKIPAGRLCRAIAGPDFLRRSGACTPRGSFLFQLLRRRSGAGRLPVPAPGFSAREYNCRNVIPEPFRKLFQRRPDANTSSSSHGTLPDNAGSPLPLAQRQQGPAIPFPVRADFLFPELRACAWQPEQVAVVTVPEAAVNKDHGAMLRQNQIGSARQILCLQPVPKSEPVQTAADQKLGLRVFPAHSCHIAAAGGGVMDVRHTSAAACLQTAQSSQGYAGA